jgi:hypothetical protein
MTSADRFRFAVADGNFRAAEAALAQYLGEKGSPRDIAEVTVIREFLAFALDAVESRRQDLARELGRLGRLEQAYCRRTAVSTWDLEA